MTDPEVVPVGPGHEDEPTADEPIAKLDVEITPDEAPAQAEDEAMGASATDIEALLFVAERPLTRAELRSVAKLSSDEIDERLGDLEVQLRDRGIRLISTGDQVMLGTSPESGQLIARYLGADTVRLSPAALETLAIIAYRQPVTRGVIERIRGVDSGHVVRGLLHRRLINELGRAETPGRPILYGTSMEFMERFGLTSLDDLPPIEAEIAARLAEAEMQEAEGDDEDDSTDEAADRGAVGEDAAADGDSDAEEAADRGVDGDAGVDGDDADAERSVGDSG
jgi:segregation and condensation protein B